MAVEVSYVLITPYSLQKSRTGGIVARLMSRTDLEFIGAQMLAFNRETADRYAAMVEADIREEDPRVAMLLGNYIRENFPAREDSRKERALLLLFQGEDACRKLGEITGRLSHHHQHTLAAGETIRDTYADMVEDKDNPDVIRYFEPAVLTPQTYERSRNKLKLFAEFAASQANLIDNAIGSEPGDERTLVIIKPDNWRHPSSRPGNIIDMLSRTGLRIVGCKLHRMSVADALDFYGPVRDALQSKLAPKMAEKAKAMLEEEFKISLPDSALGHLVAAVGSPFADDQFSQLIEFMSGRRPEQCTAEELTAQNATKCLILIYEGKNAIAKIRSVLGPTDPAKAPGGTVRRDFGSDVMVNTAHASDASDSFIRESRIVKIDRNSLASRILAYLG